MTARALAAHLLLLLAMISVMQIATELAAHPSVHHQQARVRTQHPSAPRVSQRSGPATIVTAPEPPVLVRLAEAVIVDHTLSLSVVPASVFVPPRV